MKNRYSQGRETAEEKNRWRGRRETVNKESREPKEDHKMRTRGAAISVQVSEDETETEWAECSQCDHRGWMGTYCPQCEDQGMIHSLPIRENCSKKTRNSWASRLSRGLQRLTRIQKAGNELPSVGQECLIMRGVDGQDLGQSAIVTLQTKARVRVTYVDANGRSTSKLKAPSSLILLENGLAVVRDEQGFVWVRRG
jgi:hypothetical protein